MYKITIKGEAKTEYEDLRELDGIDCQDNFADYLDDNSYKTAIKSGYMDFKYEKGVLMTYTVYNSNRELTPVELEDLKEYTTGQWSDGIGEGFEQQPCLIDDNNVEVYISPWFFEQETQVIQEKV